MTEAITSLADLTPIGAILILASVLAVGITQAAKQQKWSKQRTQLVALIVAVVLGTLAALVLGLIAGIPDTAIQVVSSAVLSIAAVAVLARTLYGVLGYVIPDGTTPETTTVVLEDVAAWQIIQRGRRADRDGVMDGRDTPDA